jgi:hypothetical protein
MQELIELAKFGAYIIRIFLIVKVVNWITERL